VGSEMFIRDRYLTMKEDAYIKMLKWFTSLSEIRRVLNT